jgi:crossover junction endodeoxyribonuclease RusA
VEPFEFVVRGVPRTARTKNKKTRNEWKDRVRESALENRTAYDLAFLDEVSVSIVYFYREETDLDVDGIGKLIIDALKGLAFADDDIVSQVLLRKTDQSSTNALNEPPDIVTPVFGIEPDFVYVSIREGPDHRSLPL